MDFSWTILAAVYTVNLAWVYVMLEAQDLDKSLPPCRSLIPGTRQRFNYMQDFWTCSYGDCFALPLLQNAFVQCAVAGFIGLYQWILFIVLAVALSVGFLVMCLGKDHKPDQGYPKVGKVSVHGILHLPHFGVSVAMGLLSIWQIIAGNLRGPVLWVALIGAGFWFLTFFLDVKTGNFDPLKKISGDDIYMPGGGFDM